VLRLIQVNLVIELIFVVLGLSQLGILALFCLHVYHFYLEFTYSVVQVRYLNLVSLNFCLHLQNFSLFGIEFIVKNFDFLLLSRHLLNVSLVWSLYRFFKRLYLVCKHINLVNQRVYFLLVFVLHILQLLRMLLLYSFQFFLFFLDSLLKFFLFLL